MKLTKFSFIFLTITILFSACQKDPDYSDTFTFGIRHDKTLSEYEALVVNASSDRPDFSPIIAFQYSLNGSDNAQYTATGTLITPEWILTAGHNFYVAEEQNEPAPVEGIRVLTGNDPNNPTGTYSVESITYHPTWLDENQDFIKANDLCLVKLSTPIANAPIATLYETDTEEIGSTVWYCGFGDYSQQPDQDPNVMSHKHAIENVLDRKNDGITSVSDGVTYTGGLLAFDFDNPSGSINSLGDDIVNSDEALLGTGSSDAGASQFEGATVQGDSGGPLFVQDNGIWKVAGVLSGGASEPIEDHQDASYGDISIFIRVSTHVDWINSVVQ